LQYDEVKRYENVIQGLIKQFILLMDAGICPDALFNNVPTFKTV